MLPRPLGSASPEVEDRVGGGLGLFHQPSAEGGSFDIPDPTRLPGD